MNFDSYVVKNTDLSLTMPLACPPPPKASHSKGLKGFTLAEVLITLSIIGVVAAMTIPTLMTKHQKQTYVTGLKKAYSTLSNAMQMLPLERGCSAGDYECAGMWSGETTIDDKTFTSTYLVNAYLLSKVLKTTTFCVDEDTKCSTNNSHEIFKENAYAKLILADGMGIAINGSDIYVDVNGVGKGPNKMGRDVFYFRLAHLTQNGVQQGTVLPYGSKLYAQYAGGDNWKISGKCNTANADSNNWDAYYCAGRVLEENAMNY